MNIEDTETVVDTTPATETTATPAEEISDLDAFKAGAEQVTPKVEDKTPDAPVGATGATGSTDQGATGATAAEGATGAAAEPTPEAKVKAELDAEIAGRGLKGKTADRFRELHAGFTKAEQLEKQLEPLRAKAVEAEQFHEILADTGANSNQVATAFGYLKAINSGDPAAMGKALDTMLEEVQWLAGQLGRTVPGVDPIAQHADLAEAVKEGEITQARAEELSRLRALEVRGKVQNEKQTEQQQLKTAYDTAMREINGPLHTRLSADPHYAAKLPTLKAAIKVMQESAHPSRWPALLETAYREIPNPAPAAAAPIAPQPLRPTGRAATLKPEPQTDLEAFKFGVEQLNGANAY